MPTIFYPQLRQEANGLYSASGFGDTNLPNTFFNAPLSFSRPPSWQSTFTTVNSTDTTTFGDSLSITSGGTNLYFISKPLKAFTLSGLVTLRFWASESNNLANASVGFYIYKSNFSTGSIGFTLYNGELTTTTAGYFITAQPTSTVFNGGDRMTVLFSIQPAPGLAMPTNRTVSVVFNSPVASVSGDTYLSFADTITQYDKTRFISSPG